MTCGSDWSGMADEDVVPGGVPGAARTSRIPDLAGPAPAGVPQLPVPRPADDPRRTGFADDAGLPGSTGSASAIDTERLFYYGNSQGGIAGGALTAVATDFTRSVLYVPGMNYCDAAHPERRLQRLRSSSLYPAYPEESTRPLAALDHPDRSGTAASRTATPTT